MAARPSPLSALRVCINLAKNSIRRLESLIEITERALDTNIRITPAERQHYDEAILVARSMLKSFRVLAESKLPRQPPTAKRKIGRPSSKEIARAKTRNAKA